jgi:hypothetical protein
LTAGILKLPTLKLLLTDLVAASLSTFFMFGLGYAFARQIEKGIREVQQWLTIIAALGVAIWLLFRYYRARDRAGLPVGPPVLDSDDVPLPPDDLQAAFPEPAAASLPGPDAGVPGAEAKADKGGAVKAASGSVPDGRPGPVEPGVRSQPQAPLRRLYDPVAVEVEAGGAPKHARNRVDPFSSS